MHDKLSHYSFFAFASALLALITPALAHADYIPPSNTELLLNSQLVAIGEIVEVHDKTYTLEIQEMLWGEHIKGEQVVITRKRDWACSMRAVSYKAGQRVLVMGNKSKTTSNHYTLQSAGHEGEALMSGDAVLWTSYAFGEVKPRNNEVKIGDIEAKIWASKLQLEAFSRAFASIKACYKTSDPPATLSRAMLVGEFVCSEADYKRRLMESVVFQALEGESRRVHFP